MFKMLRAVIGKADSMQEQVGNISREIEIPKNYQKVMLEIQNTKTEMKSTFDGFISRTRQG